MQSVWVWKKHGGANQRWKIVYKEDAEEIQTKGVVADFGFHANRPFYIVSRLPMKRVIQCHGATHTRINAYAENRVAQ